MNNLCEVNVQVIVLVCLYVVDQVLGLQGTCPETESKHLAMVGTS